MMVRRVIVNAGAPAAPPITPEQIGGDAAFIEKDEPGGVNRGSQVTPSRPGRRDISAILFGRAYRFF
jgi:hypothetical protein